MGTETIYTGGLRLLPIIANVDAKGPWKLVYYPVLISKLEYGWTNNNIRVDGGPFAVITDEYIFVTISSVLIDATYCIDILTVKRGANLLNQDSWRKGNYPLLTSHSVVFDEDGNCFNLYHARYGIN